ncbi:class I SAM-dependent methyltransferase [Pseudomonas sp. ZM23]|uniref:Class I SAM-dependent methyltransferase n=1 Tax=Pseudomonas triclosanedens TaxID=2961893 RepID=A0ABY6ZTQ3_9PSED|nr:class I SAM-dependent methyltransferase [Pseudomonas triclosanedens]MCP8466512.1 class I SAM-dependent methyltransferase [Pseudomonas triclosanedens]MCP8472133.1 class I SAM-dependent methyltransferase [Pseudomonas triclosanedens]MCP8474483.1 class I SAM-dependent methyltransferase [Pseudomonas triclosanedens]WAI48133.1 class I SAM-dependent methyltransferase [Pseudomonas triclosanedens]
MDNRSQQNPDSLNQAIEQLERQLRRIRDSAPDLMELARIGTEPPPSPRVVRFPRRRERPMGEGACNAVLLDYLYGIDSTLRTMLPDGPTDELFRYASTAAPPRALRSRRQLLAREIDRTCELLGGQARILCVGCGHLREADISRALRHGQFRDFLALDAQPQPLQTVESCYAALGIQTVKCSLDDLFYGRAELCHFDLIYSAGLYEVLDEQDARDLTRNLFARLQPGGRLLMSNFLPGIPDIAYLEGLLDWRPHYRSDSALLDLLLGIPYNDIGSARVFHDLGNCVAFLEVTRYG